MRKVLSFKAGEQFEIDGERFVRCSPLLYRRPLGTDRKGNQVLAVSLDTGKELMTNEIVDEPQTPIYKPVGNCIYVATINNKSVTVDCEIKEDW